MATKKSGIQRALEMYEGKSTALAAAIGAGVSRQNVEHWLSINRVPHERCARVALVTGIPLQELNPVHDWEEVRQALSLKVA